MTINKLNSSKNTLAQIPINTPYVCTKNSISNSLSPQQLPEDVVEEDVCGPLHHGEREGLLHGERGVSESCLM